MFNIKWENPPFTTPLSYEPSYTIPIDLSGEKLRVSVTAKPGYALVTSNGTRGTITSQDYIVQDVQFQTLYVDLANGDNGNIGSKEAPLKSLNYALTNVSDGGTIVLLNDYNSKDDSSVYFYFSKNVTLTGYGVNKVKFISNVQLRIKNGTTVTFKNIDFTTRLTEFVQSGELPSSGYDVVFDNVTGTDLHVEGNNSTTILNSDVGGRFTPADTLSVSDSSVSGVLKSKNLIASGDVKLFPNSCIEISENISADKDNPIIVRPAYLASGRQLVKVPDNNALWLSYFILENTENGRYVLKYDETSNGVYITIFERAVADNPLHIAFVPKDNGDIVTANADNNYVGLPDHAFAVVSSAVWSGYSDPLGKTWQAGDTPELTVTLEINLDVANQRRYYFDSTFDPNGFSLYEWQDVSQSFENFYKDEYAISGVETVIKEGQGIFNDGKSFTFTLLFPVVLDSNLADTDALKAAVEQFEELKSLDYSLDSYNNLKDVVDKNKGLIGTSTSQQEVDAAVTEILEAMYDLKPYLNLNVTASNGTFTVTYNYETGESNEYSLLFGTNVTLTAEADDGYEFIGWYDLTNNFYFSKSSTYSFKITTNTNLKAVCVKEQSATLTFTTYSNWIQSSVTKTIDEWSQITSIDGFLPKVPYRYGYSNGRWVYDNDNVLAKLQTGEDVSLIPVYDEDDTSFPTPPMPDGDTPVLDLYFKFDSQAEVGSFVMAAGIPDNCKIESIGIAFYYKKAAEFDPTKFELLINNKMLAGRFNTDKIEDIYIVNLNSMLANYNWAARGYVSYYDSNGNLKTVYSN